MILRIFIFLLLSAFSIIGTGQIATSPKLPVASQKVTISFNSGNENRLGYFTGELYAHTGVLIDGDVEWKHVIGSWGNNSQQPKLKNNGNGLYELEISPDINSFYSVNENEKVVKLAFVFRSSDGNKQTNDLFVNVYEDGLVVEFSNPANNTIIDKGQTVSVSADASLASLLKLTSNGAIIAQTFGTTISAEPQFNESGNFWLVAEAVVSGETKFDSIFICVREENVIEAKPLSYRKGINYPDDQTAALVLWAPDKEYVFVLGDFNDWQPENEFQMKKDGDFFWLELENLEKGKEYIFQYYIDSEILIADPYTEKISDPWNDKWINSDTYPGLIKYPEGKTEGIASIIQTGQEDYQWEATDFKVPEKGKMVIYEMLIRDFTSDHSYKSVIEKLDYLEDLHINVLELMPVNEFDGNSSWGYNPSFYFAPDKYYGPKNDLKKLIDECHKRGIAVVIDMVLNHSYGQSPFMQMYMDNWQVTANNPWYNQDHNFQNTGAHWGYDFNHESQATRELVDSVNAFWMSEYKVDGFRFDFTKGFSNTVYGPSSWGSNYDAQRIANLKRMSDEIWSRNNDAIIIFEHLADNSEEKVLADYGVLLWGNMNHNYGEGAMGYNESNKSDLSWGIYTKRNWQNSNLITYMESHDEERLTWKCKQYGNSFGNYQIKQQPTALKRMELNSVFLIPLPGPKMIWQFGERGYDQSINSFGGRLSEKPPLWNYIEEDNRLELFKVNAKLNYLKQTYEEFTPQVFYYDLDGEIKWYKLNSGDHHVLVVGNFGVEEKSANITFPVLGSWYEYFSKSNINVESPLQNLILAPGEYKLFSTRQLDDPQIKTEINIVEQSDLFNVYPNPATKNINIVSEKPLSDIVIFSLSGTVVFNKTDGYDNNMTVDVSDFQPGVYFVRVLVNDSFIIKKIIIN